MLVRPIGSLQFLQAQGEVSLDILKPNLLVLNLSHQGHCSELSLGITDLLIFYSFTK